MVVHPYRGTWSSFRHWHVWGAADDDEKLDDQRLRVNGVEQVGVSWIIIIRNLESFNDVSLLCPFPPRVDEVKYTCLGPGDRDSVSESPLNNTNYHRKILFRAQVACTNYSKATHSKAMKHSTWTCSMEREKILPAHLDSGLDQPCPGNVWISWIEWGNQTISLSQSQLSPHI